MAVLTILDSGYISNETRASQTQLSDANRAGYTGSAVTSFSLKSASVNLSGGVNVENKPVIGTLSENSSSLVSVNNRTLSVSCLLAKTIVTTGWSVNNIVQFLRLERTHGLKLLYPSATADSLPTLVEPMGQVNLAGNFSEASPTDDKGTVATTTPYLLGRVQNVRIDDLATNNTWWRVTFDFVITG